MGAQAVRLSNVDIDNALKNRDFEVLFQPIFDLGNGALARMETFVRWRHAALGLLPPGAFISFFESQGRMSELTRYVLHEALKEYRDWRGSSAPGFSINLALSDLTDDAFASHFEVMLRDCAFPAELITLECPMPPVNIPVEQAAAQFQRLAESGARLAIEVRGRANDFLRNADPFPFDEIKTGGAAILRFARTVRGPGLSAISELLEIANKSNAAITAVGVEDQASLSALRGLGFAAAQGNHLGKVGDLKSFTPSRVNDVRALLGLEPLSNADLHALFRTTAPALQAAPEVSKAAIKTSAAKPAAKEEATDALVERLHARIVRQSEVEPKAAAAEPPKPAAGATRAGARAAAKAAAIARAKRRAAIQKAAAEDAKAAAFLQEAEEGAETSAEEPAARQWQERLSREFGAMETAEAVAPRDEFDIEADEPAVAARAASRAPGIETIIDDGDEDLGAHLESFSTQAVEAGLIEDASSSEALGRVAEPVEVAAAAPRADIRAESQPVALPAAAPGVKRLAIGGARAYFRPVMRVGIIPDGVPAARLAQSSPSVAAPLRDGPSLATAGKEEFRKAVSAIGPLDETPKTAPQPVAEGRRAPLVSPAQVALSPGAPKPSISAEKGEARAALLEAEAASISISRDADAPARQAPETPPAEVVSENQKKRIRKTFLQRTVIPYSAFRMPTHFWPVSWKRAWRRRQHALAARNVETAAAE